MTEIMPVPRNSHITVLRPPSIASAAYLVKRIEEIEQMDLSVYTDSSVNTLQEALAQAKETAAQADADAEQIRQAYDALKASLSLSGEYTGREGSN